MQAVQQQMGKAAAAAADLQGQTERLAAKVNVTVPHSTHLEELRALEQSIHGDTMTGSQERVQQQQQQQEQEQRRQEQESLPPVCVRAVKRRGAGEGQEEVFELRPQLLIAADGQFTVISRAWSQPYVHVVVRILMQET